VNVSIKSSKKKNKYNSVPKYNDGTIDQKKINPDYNSRDLEGNLFINL
jgi:hypothetical protein